MGFFRNRRRKPGDVFSIDEKGFSETWMERVKKGKVGKPKPEVESDPEVSYESEVGPAPDDEVI